MPALEVTIIRLLEVVDFLLQGAQAEDLEEAEAQEAEAVLEVVEVNLNF